MNHQDEQGASLKPKVIKMKTLTVKVVEAAESNQFTVGGHEVELSTNKGTISAFVNENNYVSVRAGVFLHGLLGSAPFTSDFVKKAHDAVQAAFKDWNKESTSLNISL